MDHTPGHNLRPMARPMAVAARTDGALVRTVQERLANDQRWQSVARNGAWICPYCLSAIHRRPGRTVEESIATHLGSCRVWSGGRGTMQPEAKVAERVNFENLTVLAATDPAWRIYDHGSVWFCPACLSRNPQVRLQGGQVTSFVHQAMGAHLGRCGAYQSGRLHTAEQVAMARERHAQIPAFAQSIAGQLQQPAWRYASANGAWICPCCLQAVPEVRLRQPSDWQQAPMDMARHMLTDCPAYRSDKVVVQPESAVRQAAAASAANPIADPSIRPGTDRIGMVRTPVQGSQKIAPAAPVAAQIAAQVAAPRPIGATTAKNRLARPSSATIPPLRRSVDGTASIVRPPPPIARPVTEGNPVLAAAAEPPVDLGDTLLGRLADEELAQQAQPPTTRRRSLAGLAAMTAGQEPAAAEPAEPAAPVQATAVPTEAEPAAPTSDFSWMDREEDRAANQADEDPSAAADREEMERAAELQQDLMANAPEVEGFAFATRFIPCASISGDFYEFIPLPDGRVGLAVGDVSGHGMQAGLIMSMAKKTLEIYAGSGAGPAEVVARVNEALFRDLAGKLFVSMTYGILDPVQHTLTWVRAGHNPTIRFNAVTDQLEELKPRGMVVGMKNGPIFRKSLEEIVTPVSEGDVFLFYTDGITEAMNAQSEEFGDERLHSVIRACAADGPEPLVTQILDRVRHFRGVRPEADDMTLLAMACL
jgi:serine phosphatase RsbU (regulator of sigma subunit)